jgi:hypothetical protein
MPNDTKSPVFWTLNKLPDQGQYILHGLLGFGSASIRVPMNPSEAEKQLNKRWMQLAEQTLINICLRYESWMPDTKQIQETMEILQGDRINRTVRFCGNFIRPDKLGGRNPSLGSIGMLYAIHDVCRLRLVDVAYCPAGVSMITGDFENEYALIHFLELQNQA